MEFEWMDGVTGGVVVRWEIWELWELPRITFQNNFVNRVVVVVMVVVISDDWPHNFDSLAKDLGIPSNTLRRYFKLYQEYIPNKLAKRGTRFNRESKELFEDINKMYGQRMTTEEIMSTIAATRTPTLDVRPSAPPPAPTPDRTSPPALPEVMTALIPLAERFLSAYEAQTKALEAIASALAHNRPFGGFGHSGDTDHHPGHQTGQDGEYIASPAPRSREEIVGEVLRLRGEGLGAGAIATRLRDTGWPTTSGRGKWAKGAVRRILDKEGRI